jgi:hypothetical protein
VYISKWKLICYAYMSFNYLWMLNGGDFCEGEIVTCFEILPWLSHKAVVHRLCSQQPNEGAARTLSINMLRLILILHNSSIRIKWSKGKEEVAIAVLLIGLVMLLVCYTYKTLWWFKQRAKRNYSFCGLQTKQGTTDFISNHWTHISSTMLHCF